MMQRWFLLFVLAVAPAGAQAVTERAKSLGPPPAAAAEGRDFRGVQASHARPSAREDSGAPVDRMLLVLQGSEWLFVIVERERCDSASSKATLGGPFLASRVRIRVRF